MSNWKNNPEIVAAQSYAKQFKRRRVIIFSEDYEGRVGYASYGASGPLCQMAGWAAERCLADVEQALWCHAPRGRHTDD